MIDILARKPLQSVPFMSDQLESRLTPPSDLSPRVPEPGQDDTKPSTASASADAFFDIYDNVVKTRPGTRDAEIFEKIRQWTFSDFSQPACQFAGISKEELNAWQRRNRINLSAGFIRPERIDLERGYAWGQIRMASAVNHLRGTMGPPSRDEVNVTWSKQT